MGTFAVVHAEQLARTLVETGADVLESSDGAAFEAHARERGASLEAVVVGEGATDPIQTAQRAYRLDPALAVVLLASGAQCAVLKNALMFTPFIGNDVACVEQTNTDAVLTAVIRAAERTRLRRNARSRLVAVNADLSRSAASTAKRREQAAGQILDAAPIGILALDPERRVVAVNKEAERLLEATERELLGHDLDASRLGATRADWQALLSTATARAVDAVYGRGDRALAVRAGALAGSGGDGFLVVVRDVTEQVRASEAREAAMREAAEANRLKDEFIAMISHELRTPLTAILGWARMLRGGAVPAERLDHALEVIERNASAQAALVEDLLDVSRIISGKMRLDVRPVALGTIVTDAIESLRVAVSTRGVVLSIAIDPDLPEIVGDADRLRQVVWNLVSNAVKFTEGGLRVTVVVRRASGGVAVVVTDEGQGISADALPFIFDPFRQAEGGTTRRHGGLGLGLAISRRIAELHGGRLEASSAGLGAGATFTLTIPLAPPGSADTGESNAPSGVRSVGGSAVRAPVLAGVRVLVVEDDDDTRDLLKEVLASAGADAETASSGASARSALAAGTYDVLVSDIGMPDEDGHALMRAIRSSEIGGGRRTPAVALTAYAREVDVRNAVAAGFDRHLAKPVDLDKLVAIVRELAR